MTRKIILACVFVAGVTGAVRATDLPKIENTELFARVVRGCKEVTTDWSHPTLQVLLERGVKLTKVSLCNDETFPIFYAEVPYDPNLEHNNNYFHPLYRAMLNANKQRPFAIIATGDQTIMLITGNRESMHESIEVYTK